jgi:hypothetical protein
MTTWDEPAPDECRDCGGPILDRSDQHWRSACHCPRCDWCGAHGATLDTTLVEDDEVCRPCRSAGAV